MPRDFEHPEQDDSILNCKLWFERAVPKPEEKNFTTQLGVHFEEVHEHLLELTPQTPETLRLLGDAKRAIHEFAEHLKNNGGVEITPGRRVAYFDALNDQIVTAIGCAHMADMNIVGGFAEVDRSNWSKFVDGEPIFDENQKIAKGPAHFKPDLTPFV
jgi:hypothetical protein